MNLERIQKLSGIIGKSAAVEQVLEMIAQVAPIDISILITGESGTGKEIVARAIHKLSRRVNKPLVIVNCGAIPTGIIESELFGHKKGAFTGASEDRKGYFEEANEGSILLDEIGETPVETQVKLLRVLEEGEFMRVGDARMRKVDVRIIAATNKDLLKESASGNFRKDLFYRLRSVTIDIPALRHRPEDIDLLVERFALQFSRSNDIVFRGFTSDAILLMKQYDWPGNVRELKNFVESIIILEKGKRISSEMVMKHLSPAIETGKSLNLPVVVEKSVDQAERELILQQLLFLRQDSRDIKSLLMKGKFNHSGEVGFLSEPGSVFNDQYQQVNKEELNSIKSEEIGKVTMKDLEKEVITRTLKKFDNNRRKTATALDISERTLYRKINELGLEKKQKKYQ
ncbi:MAG: sigma-54-dependent Fis family transcriptional regulator [Candidatus Marinimicrobia bacterium]|nr:sigma-54-dependent Fis family transcriptional regulator [Candidatus Neomarinimicrobiota bacterium]MBL7046133.1 sigma-54-dependent Fis family transcriptional regulator [Candidatus Neomarinimicrobiota bacterium]